MQDVGREFVSAEASYMNDKTERKRLAHQLAVRNYHKRRLIDALAYALERLHQRPAVTRYPPL